MFTHLDEGKTVQNISQYLNPETKAWFDSTKYFFKYDDNNNWLGYDNYLLKDGNWILNFEWVTVYNTQNLKVADTFFMYDSTGTLTSGSLNEEKYSSDGLKTEWIYKGYSEGAWTNSQRRTYSYSGDFMTEEVLYFWRDNAWDGIRKETFTKEGNRITRLEEDWISDTLREDEKSITFLNYKGLDSLVENWDCTTKGEWVKETRVTSKYNSTDKIVESLTERWDSTEYKNSTKLMYEYTADTLTSATKGYYWSEGEWKKNYVNYTDYKPMDEIESIISTFTKKSLGDVQFSAGSISTSFTARELTISNLQGRIVGSVSGVTVNGITKFELPGGLANAPYVIRFVDHEGRTMGKPIVRAF